MNGINTFIFDMGNVLIDYNPFRIMEEIVGDWEAIPEIMAATVFSPLWIELDKGAVSQEDAVKTMVRQAPQHQEKIQAVMERWDETLLPIPGIPVESPGLRPAPAFQRFTALLSISKPFSGDEDDGLCPYLRQYAPDQA